MNPIAPASALVLTSVLSCLHMCDSDWVVVSPKLSALKRSESKSLKDVKSTAPISVSLPSQSKLFSPGLLRITPPSKSSESGPAKMGDEPKTPPSPPSPPTPTDAAGQLQKLLAVDLKTLDSKDPDAVAAVRKAAEFAVSRSAAGFVPQLKHRYQNFLALTFGLTPAGTGFDPDITAFNNNHVGFSIIGYCLNGDNFNQRLGRRIKAHRYSFRADIIWGLVRQSFGAGVNNASAYGEGPTPVRIVVFRDKMSAGVIPTNTSLAATSVSQTDLFLNPGAYANTNRNDTTLQWNFVTHGSRYEILYDQVHEAGRATVGIDTIGTLYTYNARKSVVGHIDLGHRVLFADDAVANPTSIIEGNVYIGFFVDNFNNGGAIANMPAYIDFGGDFTYTDN